MCLILDASCYGDFLNPNNADMKPVHDWMQRGMGKIAHARTLRIEKELGKSPRMVLRFREYIRNNQMKIVNYIDVNKKEKELKKSNILSSNDSHIIALALVAEVKLLVVSGDRNLQRDFKEIVRGKVYQNKKHKRLLRKDTCP